jgi:hypothetical protein
LIDEAKAQAVTKAQALTVTAGEVVLVILKGDSKSFSVQVSIKPAS